MSLASTADLYIGQCAPRAGDRYVWRPNAINFGVVFVELTRRSRGGFAARCQRRGGRPWTRWFPLPLPSTLDRRTWRDDELQEAH